MGEKLVIDGSGRAKRVPDDEPLDIEQLQSDGGQEPDPTPVGTFDPDTLAAASEEGGNGGGQG